MKIVGKIRIDQGETYSKTWKFRKNGGYDAEDLSSASAITVAFRNTDDSFLTLSLSGGVAKVGSGAAGDITVTLTAEQTALLKKGKNLTVEVSWTIAGAVTYKKLEGILDVTEIESAS